MSATDKFRNVGDDGKTLHFPGFHVEAAQFLIEQPSMKAIAVDTLSLDFGPSPDFIVHNTWLPAGRYGIEGIANLDRRAGQGRDDRRRRAEDQRAATGGPARILRRVRFVDKPPAGVVLSGPRHPHRQAALRLRGQLLHRPGLRLGDACRSGSATSSTASAMTASCMAKLAPMQTRGPGAERQILEAVDLVAVAGVEALRHEGVGSVPQLAVAVHGPRHHQHLRAACGMYRSL